MSSTVHEASSDDKTILSVVSLTELSGNGTTAFVLFFSVNGPFRVKDSTSLSGSKCGSVSFSSFAPLTVEMPSTIHEASSDDETILSVVSSTEFAGDGATAFFFSSA
jgi:hypothetical protein